MHEFAPMECRFCGKENPIVFFGPKPKDSTHSNSAFPTLYQRNRPMIYGYEYTDTFAGEANYCWVKRGTVSVPDLTHYGYDGSNGYSKADKAQTREVIRQVKRALGITERHVKADYGDMIRLDFKRAGTVCFILYSDSLN